MNEPTLAALVARDDTPPALRALAERYAPRLVFDANEPFMPLVAGYTILHAPGPSPSTPRQLDPDNGGPDARTVIEYAIWWDWDISHLYDLEHVWVYLDENDEMVHAEGSWHGDYTPLTVDDHLPLEGDRLRLLAEPGKHAFAPAKAWFQASAHKIRERCSRPGSSGVLVTPLYEGTIDAKSWRADWLVRTYLEPMAFEPSFNFTKSVPLTGDQLVAWPLLYEWIPQRIEWVLDDIATQIDRRPWWWTLARWFGL